jgi:hypothetical protein
LNQSIQIFEPYNKNSFSFEIKENWETVYYPSSKAIKDGIEKSMA